MGYRCGRTALLELPPFFGASQSCGRKGGFFQPWPMVLGADIRKWGKIGDGEEKYKQGSLGK